MKITSPLFFALVSACILSQLSASQTEPVGVIRFEVPPGSDALLSAPLTRAPDFQGEVSSVDGTQALTVGGSPNWDNDEFAGTHYLRVESGPLEGAFALISSNDSNSIELIFISEDLRLGEATGVTVGDQLAVVPLWTLATLFPDDITPDRTQILLFDRQAGGVNVGPSVSYTSFDGFGWFSGPNEGNSEVIYPDESFILRTPDSSGLNFSHTGSVNAGDLRFVLEQVVDGQPQDLRITTSLPVPITLQELFDFGAVADGDQVLIFENSTTGINKGPTFSVTYFDGFGWFSGPTERNDYELLPGTGFIYRKAADNAEKVTVLAPNPVQEASQ